jgi:hypothetical protein
LKESFNKAFDSQIREHKLQEKITELNNLGFGDVKSLFEGISDKLFDNHKDCVAKYIKTIKENNDLKTLYVLYENAIKPSHVNDVNLLVSSMVAISESINSKSLKEGMKKLHSVLTESIIKAGVSAEDIDAILNENKEINESLTYILTNKKTAKNLFEHTNMVHSVVNYINENMGDDKINDKVNDKINDKTNSDLINDLNEAISCDTPWETEAIKDLTLCYLSESNSEELFNRYKNECIELLEEKISDADSIEEGVRFSTMKESLSKKEYNKDKIKESILTLAELKYTLISE